MRRLSWGLVLLILAIPNSSTAIQLHWNGDATDLSFTEATRCTLVVQADTAEGRLPVQWRLLWTADSAYVSPVPISSDAPCQTGVAEARTVSAPSTSTEIAENVVTAQFCSSGDTPASSAQFVLDLPGGKKGKFKVVALDPADPDSAHVIESGVATFNGGVEADFRPVVLRSTTDHRSTAFRLSAVGAGLSQAQGLALSAPDGSWQMPLNIATQSETAISATASLAASVPASVVELSTANGSVASASVPSDPPPPPLAPENGGCVRRFEEVLDPQDPYMIQPKDFAFVPGGWTPSGSWTFHLFYIRQNQRIAMNPNTGPNFTSKNIGHQVSNDLANWNWPRSQAADTMAIRTRGGRFDSLHVWAPTIVQQGLTYYMFYTGVDKDQKQRIGLATSTDLLSWTQTDSVLEVNNSQIPWAEPSPLGPRYGGAAQLRDPYVMPDPDVPGDWLMYFVTVSKAYSPGMVVGVARSHGDMTSWGSSFALPATHHPWPADTTFVVESPHAFYRGGNWWVFSTVNGDSVWANSDAYSPTDTVAASSRWTPGQKLWTLVPPDQAGWFYYWHATEYLQVSAANDIEYLAAFTDDIVGISYTQMRPATSPYLFNMDCPSAAAVGGEASAIKQPGLLLTGAMPARSHIGFRIQLPAKMRVHLAVYDVLGRRLRVLADGELPSGTTDMMWDGHDASGAPVDSGVYFACMTTEGTRRAVRVPLIR